MHCVRERKYRAGGAPERVREHIVAARSHLDADRRTVMLSADRIEAARNRLDVAFADLQKSHAL
jgi:hypothetical protein